MTHTYVIREHNRVYLGMNSPYVGENHEHVNLGLDTCL